MKRILLLATGGTIACRPGEDGLGPQAGGAELLRGRQDLDIHVQDLMAVDSTDMTDAQRLAIGQAVWAARQDYDGFVVTHGSDTMAYTAALLGRMLQHFDKPVIFTGSMLPMEAPGSDAPANLDGALAAAVSAYRGTAVFFDGQLYPANAVTKFHSTHRHAFACVHGRPDGEIQPDGRLRLDVCSPPAGEPRFVWPRFGGTAVVYVTPALQPEDVLAWREKETVFVLGYGVGGIPEGLTTAFVQLLEQGARVYILSQCALGGADGSVYAAHRRLIAAGARHLEGYSLEDALACAATGVL